MSKTMHEIQIDVSNPKMRQNITFQISLALNFNHRFENVTATSMIRGEVLNHRVAMGEKKERNVDRKEGETKMKEEERKAKERKQTERNDKNGR